MQILLPPSEAKISPPKGSRLDLRSLTLARNLAAPQEEVLLALTRLASGPRKKAIETLGLPPGLATEVDRNAKILSAPTASAIEIYSGVLYNSLGWQTLPVAAKKRGKKEILIISALFGALRPSDRIPAYRLSMDVTLPKIGSLASFWKKHLTLALEGLDSHIVIDLRSQTYAKTWIPKPSHTAQVRVFTEQAGKRTVISHMAKLTRGEVARELLLQTKVPNSIEAAVKALSKKFKVEIVEPSRPNKPFLVDIILE